MKHVMNLAPRCVPLRARPWGAEDMTRGGRGGLGAFFNAGGHCCSDTQEETNSEDRTKKISVQKNKDKMLHSWELDYDVQNRKGSESVLHSLRTFWGQFQIVWSWLFHSLLWLFLYFWQKHRNQQILKQIYFLNCYLYICKYIYLQMIYMSTNNLAP